MRDNVQPGDKVELKDKEGGFTDPVTGFDISRDQQLPLGDTIGQRTHEAIVSGGLLVVSGRRKSQANTVDDDPSEDDGTGFADDYPGREALVAAGLTQADVDELDEEGLIAVHGIGKKSAEAILALRSE